MTHPSACQLHPRRLFIVAPLVPPLPPPRPVNFSQWVFNKGWTFVGSYDDYGSLYRPADSLTPDCAPYSVSELDPLTPPMEKAFDGVLEALRYMNSTHCACRDDWPTQCVWYVYD